MWAATPVQHRCTSLQHLDADCFSDSLRLKQFQKFDSTTTALGEVSSLVESKVSPLLASLLETVKDEKKVSLAVADPKLGAACFSLQNRCTTAQSLTMYSRQCHQQASLPRSQADLGFHDGRSVPCNSQPSHLPHPGPHAARALYNVPRLIAFVVPT